MPLGLWQCWLGDRKGIQPAKISASKPTGKLANVSGSGYNSKYPKGDPICLLQKEGMNSFGMSQEDAYNTDDWRLRIKGD